MRCYASTSLSKYLSSPKGIMKIPTIFKKFGSFFVSCSVEVAHGVCLVKLSGFQAIGSINVDGLKMFVADKMRVDKVTLK